MRLTKELRDALKDVLLHNGPAEQLDQPVSDLDYNHLVENGVVTIAGNRELRHFDATNWWIGRPDTKCNGQHCRV